MGVGDCVVGNGGALRVDWGWRVMSSADSQQMERRCRVCRLMKGLFDLFGGSMGGFNSEVIVGSIGLLLCSICCTD